MDKIMIDWFKRWMNKKMKDLKDEWTKNDWSNG